MKAIKFKILGGLLFLASMAFSANLTTADGVPVPDSIVLTENNHVLLRGDVDDESIAKAIKDFSRILAKRKSASTHLYLVLDTPGGSVIDGYRLYEFVKSYSNIHTITLNSFSMGAVLVELIDGQRLITSTGTIMFHRMRAGIPGYSTTEQLHSRTRYYESLERVAEDRICERVGVCGQELKNLLNEELWLTGKQAVERKYVDKIVSLKCDEALLKKKEIQVVQPLPFLPPMEVEVSACPLL